MILGQYKQDLLDEKSGFAAKNLANLVYTVQKPSLVNILDSLQPCIQSPKKSKLLRKTHL